MLISRPLSARFQLYIICSILLFSLPMFIDDYEDNVKLHLLPYMLPVSSLYQAVFELYLGFESVPIKLVSHSSTYFQKEMAFMKNPLEASSLSPTLPGSLLK